MDGGDFGKRVYNAIMSFVYARLNKLENIIFMNKSRRKTATAFYCFPILSNPLAGTYFNIIIVV